MFNNAFSLFINRIEQGAVIYDRINAQLFLEINWHSASITKRLPTQLVETRLVQN